MNDDEKQALLIDHGLREAELLRKLEQQTDWYQQRFNALRKWVNTEVRPLSEDAANRYFAIVANGSPSPHEQADWRETLHGLTLRAEQAERSLKTVETELANTRNIAALETQRANRMSDLLSIQEDRLDSMLELLAKTFGWEDKSYAHAVMHIENAVNNLRADCAAAWREANAASNSVAPLHESTEKLKVSLEACSESRNAIIQIWENKQAELSDISNHLKDFVCENLDTPFARVLSLHGAYLQLRNLLLELAEATQPPDMPHADLTPLHRLHMKVNAALGKHND